MQLAVQTNTQTDRQEIRPHFYRREKLLPGLLKHAWNKSVHVAVASLRFALPERSL